MTTFQQYLSEDLKRLGKIRLDKRKMTDPVKAFFKDPIQSHRFRQSRGMNRKSLKQVPDRYSHSRAPDLHAFMKGMDIANKIVGIAKKSPSGVWRISKAQVLEIARKYKFNVPDDTKPLKHLGSTGIQIIRYRPGVFYLYKPRRPSRKKRVRGIRQQMKDTKLSMGMGK